MDPVSLVLNALTSGAAQGVAESASDAVKAAYSRLKRLVSGRFAGNKTAEVALVEHADDPDTWQAPLAKALANSGASADRSVIEAAQQLMALLDEAGTREGKYRVDLRGAQGVQVGDGNRQYNTFAVSPEIVVAQPTAQIRPGQLRNEAAFGPAYRAAGGAAFLGDALDEVYEDGPGFVQHFGGGSGGEPSVICALYEHEAVAVAQTVWDELSGIGRGGYDSGTAGVGFPVADPSGQHPFIGADIAVIELAGGSWGRGQLARTASGRRRWQPRVAFDSQAYRDQDVWAFRRREMDLRLRLATRIPLVAEGLRVTETGRSRMLARLRDTGFTDLIATLAGRYGINPGELTWVETPDPEGYNNSRFAAYQLIVPAADGRPALAGALWFMLPDGRATELGAVVDLSIDFDAIQPGTKGAAPAEVSPGLRVTISELIGFFISAWQAAMVLPLTAVDDLLQVPPAGPPRLEFYIQNRHPENAGGPRTLRTLDMVNLSAFGRSRKTQIIDLAVGVTAPLGLAADEIGLVVRQALTRMAEDYSFTAAETAKI